MSKKSRPWTRQQRKAIRRRTDDWAVRAVLWRQLFGDKSQEQAAAEYFIAAFDRSHGL